MKRMGKKEGTYLAIVAFAMLCVFAQPALAAPAVSVEPSYQKVLQGQNFTVNITIDPAGVEVMGAQYELHFNNTMLNGTEQTKGPFLSHDGASTNVFVNKINNTIGVVKYGETRIGVDYGVTTPGTLATITFKAMEPGTSSLNMSEVKLSDPIAQPIPGVLVLDGTVEIEETHFNISGFVNYSDGSPVNNPNVTVANLNTTEVFIAEMNESSNYYQVSTNLLHISEGNLLYFFARDNMGNFTEFNHTVTEEEINSGGFSQNITIYVPDTTPPVITNVSAISITKDAATLTWETDEPSNSLVKYGTEPGNYTEIVYSASCVTYHNISIANLTPNTTYYYVVNSTDPSNNSAQSSELNFMTFPEIIIGIGNAGTLSGENATVSIVISNITNAGTADIILSYNQSVVHVIALNDSDFDFMDATIDNSSGITRIGAFQTSSSGLNGEVLLANVTFQAVGNGGESCTLNLTINELKEASEYEISIPATTHNGTFTVAEITPPVVTNPIANPASIPEDTDFEPRWGEMTQLNITVTDDCGVAGVTINLSSIGGLPDQPMTRISGTDIWTVTVNASVGTAILITPDTTPPAISNVTASEITNNSALITWDTDELADSLVRYGTTPGNYTDSASNATLVLNHSVPLSGLLANTTYYYVVNSTDVSGNAAQSAEYNFTTLETP
jgi:hypothetical protein